MFRVFWHRWRAKRNKKLINIFKIIYEHHVDELYILASYPNENISTAAKMAIVQLEEESEYWDGIV